MGLDALEGNGITKKLLYFLRDRALTPVDEPLRRVRKSRILLFVALQLTGFGATMAVTQTIGKCTHHASARSHGIFLNLIADSFHTASRHRFSSDYPAVGPHEGGTDPASTVHGGRARCPGWSHSLCLRTSAIPVELNRVPDELYCRPWLPLEVPALKMMPDISSPLRCRDDTTHSGSGMLLRRI